MWVFFKNMSIAPLGKDIMQRRRKMRCIYAAHLQVCFVERPMPTDQAALDAFDIAILRILQQDNTTPQRTIGEAVNLSAPAVQRRIKRMEQNGVIRQNTALLDPAKVGQPITIFVEVEVESEKAELIDALKQSFAAAPEVQQCYYVTGEADFVLVVLVPDMAHYERLTRRLFFDSGNVRKFRTFVAMDNVKSTLSVPL
jgi:Lrp/AsnC family leucine-responsive transcriptional regulator